PTSPLFPYTTLFRSRSTKGAATVATPRQKLPAKQITKDHKGRPKVSEAQIAVHWKEEGYYRPPAKFTGQANLHDPDFVAKFDERSEEHTSELQSRGH